MKSRKTSHGYLLVLKKGEQLASSLIKFCQDQKIQAAWVSGIGAVTEAEVGFYDLSGSGEYRWHKFDELMEITNVTGNVATLNGELISHLHTTLSDGEYKARGGHLKEATIGGTCELLLRVLDGPLTRQHDDETGLNLLDL